MIQKIKRKKMELPGGDWEAYVMEVIDQGEEYFDALCYACESGAEMLEEQASYFHDCLLNDEKYYYAGRMGGFEI